MIPRDAHIRIVHPTKNDGARMLRRGYNFVDGSDALGGLDAGLFFIAFVRDPETQFIPLQNRMAQMDALDGVPEVHLVGDLRGPAGGRPGGVRRAGPVRLSAPTEWGYPGAGGNTTRAGMVEKYMMVEIWSDVVCPWCAIGRSRLDAALADFAHADGVEVVAPLVRARPRRAGRRQPADGRGAGREVRRGRATRRSG